MFLAKKLYQSFDNTLNTSLQPYNSYQNRHSLVMKMVFFKKGYQVRWSGLTTIDHILTRQNNKTKTSKVFERGFEIRCEVFAWKSLERYGHTRKCSLKRLFWKISTKFTGKLLRWISTFTVQFGTRANGFPSIKKVMLTAQRKVKK